MGIEEAKIEKYLKKRVEERNGLCIKLVNVIGIPDRLVIMPGGVSLFLEAKSAIGRASRAQELMINMLGRMGHSAGFIRSKQQVDLIMGAFDEQ